jgi:hypothetical protein
MTECEARIINMEFKAAQAAGITLPLKSDATITGRQLEVYNEVLLREFRAFLKNKEA